jgi:hypothetical protein
MKLASIVLACTLAAVLLAGLVLKFLVAALGEGQTGVRLKAGIPTQERIAQGLYFKIPHFYDIERFHGGIHISAIRLACKGPDGSSQTLHSVKVLWNIVDGRAFYPLTRAQPEMTHAQVGEIAIEQALCAWQASTASGSLLNPTDQHELMGHLDAVLPAHKGIRVLTLQDKRP